MNSAPPSRFISRILQGLCDQGSPDCPQALQGVSTAHLLDLDYDTISSTLVVRTFWQTQTHGDTSRNVFDGHQTIELGVFDAQEPDAPEEHKLSGWLTVLGENNESGNFSQTSRSLITCSNHFRAHSLLFSQPPPLNCRFQRQCLDFPSIHR